MRLDSSLPREDTLARLRAKVAQRVAESAHDWWSSSVDKASRDAGSVALILPGTTRRLGAAPLVEPTEDDRFLTCSDFTIDLAAYRVADAGGALLIVDAIDSGADPALLRNLYDHGDLNERTIVLRSLAMLGDLPVVHELLGEAQRSNTLDHVEAGFCDSDLVSRVFDEDEFNRAVLKLAFVDVPVWRLLGANRRANADLSRVLLDFATEREAAGRPVWISTMPLIARAPVAGTTARIVGRLEHGDDQERLTAAQSIAFLEDPSLARFVQERVEREPRDEIRAALMAALDSMKG